MARQMETSERPKRPELATNYYSNSKKEVNEGLKTVMKNLGYVFKSESEEYGEALFISSAFSVTSRIFMWNPRETSVDLFIVCKKLIPFGQNIKEVSTIYSELKKILNFKGVSLHING